MAAQASVRYSLENPDAYIQSNIVGFFNVLEACKSFGVEHLIYASSSSVYGGNKKIPFATTERVDEPITTLTHTKEFERDFDFRPKISLREGLRKFAARYKNFYIVKAAAF